MSGEGPRRGTRCGVSGYHRRCHRWPHPRRPPDDHQLCSDAQQAPNRPQVRLFLRRREGTLYLTKLTSEGQVSCHMIQPSWPQRGGVFRRSSLECRHHLHSYATWVHVLVAITDWHRRYVVAWQLSNTLDGRFCLDAPERSLAQRQPEILNTGQGAQSTAQAFTYQTEHLFFIGGGTHYETDT